MKTCSFCSENVYSLVCILFLPTVKTSNSMRTHELIIIKHSFTLFSQFLSADSISSPLQVIAQAGKYVVVAEEVEHIFHKN